MKKRFIIYAIIATLLIVGLYFALKHEEKVDIDIIHSVKV